MIINALTREFKTVAWDVPYSNLMWTCRYFDFGQFQMQIPVDLYNESWFYIASPNSGNVGMVQRVEYRDEDGGAFLLSGFFVEKALDNAVVSERFRKVEEVDLLCYQLINKHYKNNTVGARVPITPHFNEPLIGDTYHADFVGDYLGTKLFSMLQTQGLSQIVKMNDAGNGFDWGAYSGVDRSTSQSDVQPVILSRAQGDITDVSVVLDDSAYRNTCIVAYNEQEDGSLSSLLYVTENDQYGPTAPGWVPIEPGYQLQTYVESSGKVSDSTPLAVLQGEADAKGREKLDKCKKTLDIDAKLYDVSRFGKDFKLGDVVTVLVEGIGLELDTRIVESVEVYKNGSKSVSVGFGNKRITNMQRMVQSWK